MISNPLTGLFSPATRKRIYVLFALAGFVVGAIIAYCAAAHVDQPTWVDGATAVLTYTGAVLGLTAASNVPTPDTDEEGGGEGGEIGIVLLILVVLLGVLLLR